MRLRPLGKIPFAVSEIGLGTAQLANTDGSAPGVKPVSPDEAQKIVHAAIDAGVNFFDTGDQYGTAELTLGELAPSTKRGLLIATKAGLRDDGIRDFSEEYLRGRIERSLKRLKVDSLDLFQVNKPKPDQICGVTDVLAGFKKEGLIRRAGMVVGEPAAGEICLSAGVIDCLQVMYNLVCQEAEGLIQRAAKAGVGVFVRSPLNSGLLSGKIGVDTVFPPEDERSRYFAGPEFKARVRALKDIQAELGVSDAELVEFALSFILSEPAVSSVIPGASSSAQLERLTRCGASALFGADRLALVRAVVTRRMAGLDQSFQFS